MGQVMLTRDQIKRIQELFELDPELNQVYLDIKHSSGIGPTVYVRYQKQIDITDVESW
jgi:hypothetical protein